MMTSLEKKIRWGLERSFNFSFSSSLLSLLYLCQQLERLSEFVPFAAACSPVHLEGRKFSESGIISIYLSTVAATGPKLYFIDYRRVLSFSSPSRIARCKCKTGNHQSSLLADLISDPTKNGRTLCIALFGEITHNSVQIAHETHSQLGSRQAKPQAETWASETTSGIEKVCRKIN